MVESLDLLLFQSTHFNGSLQRALTNSPYDHVALLFHYQNDIKIFDSTSGAGVTISSWDRFVKQKIHKGYHRLVLRKLHCKRDERLMNRFKIFLTEHKGKRFAFNPF